MSTRILLPNEFDLYQTHIMNLDSQGRFCRFGGYLSDNAVKSYLDNLKYTQNIIIGHFDQTQLVGAALISFDSPISKEICELALSIDQSHRKRGLGKKLFKRAMLWACNLGFRKIHTQCLQQNQWTVNQAKKLGFQLTNEEGEVYASMEPKLSQKLGMPNLLTTELLEWNDYVLENVFGYWRRSIFGFTNPRTT
jgi:RimJ/RimL family protein N-acetyltransferase